MLHCQIIGYLPTPELQDRILSWLDLRFFFVLFAGYRPEAKGETAGAQQAVCAGVQDATPGAVSETTEGKIITGFITFYLVHTSSLVFLSVLLCLAAVNKSQRPAKISL